MQTANTKVETPIRNVGSVRYLVQGRESLVPGPVGCEKLGEHIRVTQYRREDRAINLPKMGKPWKTRGRSGRVRMTESDGRRDGHCGEPNNGTNSFALPGTGKGIKRSGRSRFAWRRAVRPREQGQFGRGVEESQIPSEM
jgi:hypothetical protein